MALNSGIQTYQILINDDEFCIPSLSSIFLAVYSSNRIRKTQNEHLIVVFSKFDRSVIVKLKPINYFVGVYTTQILI